jgi:mannose-1-phosphate guanylyltransferase / phosphomannomutase
MNDSEREMKSVVMAGGQGTRLRPLTSNQPKPMVPVANKPMMEHVVELMKKHGLTETVVTLQFLPTIIKNYFDDGSDWGMSINYVTEESPMGTAGGVLNARAFLDRTFLVVSGDALTDIDLTSAARFHRKTGSKVTIVLKSVDNPLEFGLVICDPDGRITKFLEKPGWGEVFSDTINTGIYIIEPEVLDFIPEDRPYDFSKELFPRLLEEGWPLYGYVAEGYWCDVGNLEQYVSAHRDILDGKVDISMSGHKLENGIWMGDGVEIDDSVEVSGPVLIGNHVRVEPNTKIREYTVLGDNVVVKTDNFLHRSVFMDNTYVGPSCHIRGAVVSRNCDIKAGVRIDEGSVIGDDCLIGEGAIINPGVLIYPFKTVDSRATINTSIIWESRGMRSLFGKRGVSGLINVDISPETAVRLGMAYGSTLPLDSQVVTSRGGSRSSRIIKRAFMAGLNSTGVHIRDLEVNAVPVNRFTVDSYNNQGGVDFRTSDRDPQLIEMNFHDEEARDIDQGMRRKIEAVFNRNDFRRAFQNELGEIFYPARAREAYIQALLERVDLDVVRPRGFKVVFDYGYGAASLLMPAVLGKLECEVMSLNAFTDESKILASRPFRKDSLARLGEMVRNFTGDLGVFFDNGAERLAIAGPDGEVITSSKLLVVMVDLITRSVPSGVIAVPVDQPSAIERIAGERGFEVLRTRVDRSSLMSAAWEEGVVFAGSGDGGYIFPEFMPAYDAMMACAKLLEMLASCGLGISEVLSGLPSFEMKKREVFTSWEKKGAVMRRLLEQHHGDGIESTDGIKITWDDRRWILVLPDEDEPLLHLKCEGQSEKDCEEILNWGEEEINRPPG